MSERVGGFDIRGRGLGSSGLGAWGLGFRN